MGKSAVVLELDSSNVTLLTEEGAFLRIPAKRLPVARYVGQQVDLAELKSPHCGRWLSLAAACLIFILVIPLFRPTPAQAWVTLDGSPSLEVLLDDGFRVLEVRALNSAGLLFLEDHPQCEDFSALVESYFDWSAKNGDDRVLITATASAGKVNQLVSRTDRPVDVVLIEVHPKAREEADKLGLSTGRALFAAGADGQGIDISPAKIKDGNLFATLTDAGANIDQVISSSSNRKTQVEKIRDLPKPDPDPSEDSAQDQQPGAPEQVDSPGAGGNSRHGKKPPGLADRHTPPGQAGKGIPPGLAGKGAKPGPANRDTPPGLLSRGTVPGQAGKGSTLGHADKEPPGHADKEPPGHAGKNTPPGLAGKDKKPGQGKKDPPPGQAGKTPPGQAGKDGKDVPGLAGKNTTPPPGGKNAPPGQVDKGTPPGQGKKDTAPGQPGKTPPGQAGKALPPGQAKKEQEKGQALSGLVEESRPQPAEPVLVRNEEKNGPTSRGKGAPGNANKGNGVNNGKGKGPCKGS
ncbi:MAG: anti-sigma-I factor RsgI family protein [Bacillota bacterium]|jgi:hypothetical protein